MLSNSAWIFIKERKKKYNVCGTHWQKEKHGGRYEIYFLLKYIRWKVVLGDTKKEGNSCPRTRINRLNYVTISRTAMRLSWCSMHAAQRSEWYECAWNTKWRQVSLPVRIRNTFAPPSLLLWTLFRLPIGQIGLLMMPSPRSCTPPSLTSTARMATISGCYS